MIILEKPRLCDITAMQEIIKPEVESGVILPRSNDEIATYIRSYTLAYVCDDDGDGEILHSEMQNVEISGSEISHTELSSEISSAHSAGTANIDKIGAYTQYFRARPKNAKLAGYASLKIFNADLAEVRALVVSPEFRGHGIGTKIVGALLDEAKFYGLKNIFALTYQKSFFVKNGFAEISKDELPVQKIWADCISCKKFPICNEIAVIYTL